MYKKVNQRKWDQLAARRDIIEYQGALLDLPSHHIGDTWVRGYKAVESGKTVLYVENTAINEVA